ncbi:capsular exopolysaccharide synthesis family protein [Caulobacter ginsengisoli]|uniref:non-specific protein-tyrosine kinase n=1 Tax=Caulobacter ginsengisoli TaxID=400775 RepID=A0ABU0IPL4_9CAUL|nr:polysaccharide biosynthesis tyrosine autokinase [Caulobacter ginsengisoli]MDQ0463108.1 capsular exopolysaccharide synthesis family protein [Caulobacter ginsengisoli]
MPSGEQNIEGGSFDRSSPIVILRNQNLPDPRLQGLLMGGPGDETQDEGLEFMQYLHIIQKHWMVILAAVAVAIGIGIAVTLMTQRVYEAGVTVQIDKEAAQVVDVQNLEPADQGSYDEFFQTQYGLIKSESLASRVVDKLGLVNEPATLHLLGLDSSQKGGGTLTFTQKREALITYLLGNLNVAPVQRSRLVRITFDSPDRQFSARIANAFADNFIASNLDRRFDASAYARKFLEERLAETKARLEQSERDLVGYARQQQIINVPAGGGTGGAASGSSSSGGSPSGTSGSESLTATSLVALNSALSTARAERIMAEQRWRQSQATGGAGTLDPQQNLNIQQLTLTKANLQAEYQDKLSRFKPDFPDMIQLKNRIDGIQAQIDGINANSRSSSEQALKAQYDVALRQERSLEAQVNQMKGSVLDLRDRSIQYDIYQREVDTNRTLYDGLLQRYKEIGVAGGLANNNVSIIDHAKPPRFATKPSLRKNLVTSALLGLILGIGLAFLIEMMDESIRSVQDVERKLGLPLLGSIPKLEKGTTPAEAIADLRSPFAEAYYSVQTALQFSTEQGIPRSLAVLSARPSEGKTTSATAIARNLARLGTRVLLIDSDLRNPSLHRVMGVENSAGLSNYLSSNAGLEHFVKESTQPNLYLMPSGPLPPNPAQLLAGARLLELLKDAGSVFDIVVFDAPPIMGLADAPLLASRVGGVVLVVESGRTGRKVVKAAIRRLKMGNARILGVLLTKFDLRVSGYGYGYGYGYSYNYDYSYGTKPAIEDGKRSKSAGR